MVSLGPPCHFEKWAFFYSYLKESLHLTYKLPGFNTFYSKGNFQPVSLMGLEQRLQNGSLKGQNQSTERFLYSLRHVLKIRLISPQNLDFRLVFKPKEVIIITIFYYKKKNQRKVIR